MTKASSRHWRRNQAWIKPWSRIQGKVWPGNCRLPTPVGLLGIRGAENTARLHGDQTVVLVPIAVDAPSLRQGKKLQPAMPREPSLVAFATCVYGTVRSCCAFDSTFTSSGSWRQRAEQFSTSDCYAVPEFWCRAGESPADASAYASAEAMGRSSPACPHSCTDGTEMLFCSSAS